MSNNKQIVPFVPTVDVPKDIEDMLPDFAADQAYRPPDTASMTDDEVARLPTYHPRLYITYDQRAAPLIAKLEEQEAARAKPEVMMAWLRGLDGVVSQSLPIEQLTTKIRALMAVFDDTPAYCWTEETLKIAAKECQWFPSAAELNRIFERRIEHYRQARALLRRMALAPKPQPKFRESTEKYAPNYIPEWAKKRTTRHMPPPEDPKPTAEMLAAQNAYIERQLAAAGYRRKIVDGKGVAVKIDDTGEKS
jgi:hypothetical protein